MKASEKLFKATTAVAGILAVACALLLIVLIALAEIGVIHPRKMPLAIRVENASKIYDGEPLEAIPEITYGTLIDGHHIEVLSRSALTKVGEIDGVVELMIVDGLGTDVTDQYDITLSPGKLSVTKRAIKLASDSASKVYDGKPLEHPKLIDKSKNLAEGDYIEILSAPSLQEPGSIMNNISYRILSKNGEDVTDQYSVSQNSGTLRINPVPLVIRSGSASKRYDGTPLSCEEYTISKGALINGHSLVITSSTKITTAEEVENDLKFVIRDADGNDVSGRYDIQLNKGTLRVDGISLTIKTGSLTKEYDGIPAESDEWSLAQGTLPAGHRVQLVESTSFDGVGSVDNVMRFVVVDRNDIDVTNQYTITYAYGTLSVTPRKLTVETGSDKKIYDGKALVCSKYTLTSGELCPGHTLTLVGTGKTEIGSYDNRPVSYKISESMSDGTVKDVTSCYQIAFVYGKLNISSSDYNAKGK